MLEVKRVSCKYDSDDVVKDVSFSVKEHEHICILGVNGCGKTTLLRTIAGILPYRGEILVCHKNLSKMKRKEAASHIALMSQIPSVYFSYTVYETVMLGRYIYMPGGILGPSKIDAEIVMDCLETVGLADLKDRSITGLSGGQLQRVFLARAFAQNPRIILLDEPTNHLDLKLQAELLAYLREWSSEESRAVIGVFHDINLALQFADKILVMKDGAALSFENVEKTVGSGDLSLAYGMDVNRQMNCFCHRWENLSSNQK